MSKCYNLRSLQTGGQDRQEVDGCRNYIRQQQICRSFYNQPGADRKTAQTGELGMPVPRHVLNRAGILSGYNDFRSLQTGQTGQIRVCEASQLRPDFSGSCQIIYAGPTGPTGDRWATVLTYISARFGRFRQSYTVIC